MTLLLCLFLIILLIFNSPLVISGATKGLMLWYQSILPMLLPFMLISGLLVHQVKLYVKTHSKPFIPVIATFVLGLFCGYPIGAKTCADFASYNLMPKPTANIILPICNNASPMFITGYIVYRTLNNTISIWKVMLLIYIPYILYLLICVCYNWGCKRKLVTSTNIYIQPATLTINEYIHNVINQITVIGVYMMICSIATEFLFAIPYISKEYKSITSSVIEITRGVSSIQSCVSFGKTQKIALIISTTSFGGLSSIFQTGMVLQNSELSLVYYTVVKVICAIASYMLCILFI